VIFTSVNLQDGCRIEFTAEVLLGDYTVKTLMFRSPYCIMIFSMMLLVTNLLLAFDRFTSMVGLITRGQ